MTDPHDLYHAEAGARLGRVESPDRVLDLPLATPESLGGAGGAATNPEQLFAAAYAACLLEAIEYVAARDGLALSADARVDGRAALGRSPQGFSLAVSLAARLPNLDAARARQVVDAARAVWPAREDPAIARVEVAD